MNEDAIKAILGRLALETPSTWATLVARLGEHEAALFRACAIARRITPDVVRAVAQDLGDPDPQALYERFASLKLVVPQPDSLMVHDDTRSELFRSWFARPAEFRNISARLAGLHERKATEADDPDDARHHVWEALFHRVAVDQAAAIERFLDLFQSERRLGRTNGCAQLIALLREYGEFLTFESERMVRYSEGLLAMDRGDWSESVDIFSMLLDHGFDGEIEFKLMLLMQKGRALLALGQLARAADVLQTGINLATAREGSQRILTSLLFDYADSMIRQGELDDAERKLRQGLRCAERLGDSRLQAKALDTLAFLFRRRLDFRLAVDLYRQAFVIYQGLRDERCQAHVLGGLGMSHLEIGEYREALDVFQQRLAILRRLGDRHGEAITLNNLIRIHLYNNDQQNAIRSAERAFSLFLSTRDRLSSAKTRFNLGKVYGRAGNHQAAQESFRTAEFLFNEVGALDQVAAVRQELAQLAR